MYIPEAAGVGETEAVFGCVSSTPVAGLGLCIQRCIVIHAV